MNKGREEVLASRVLLGLALVSALLVRCLPWRNFVNPQGGFYFYSTDSYDHLRRITLGVKRFPGLADFDFYAAFPQGLGQIWAPGFDYLLSALCLLAGGTREAIETICFFFNPVAAAFTVLLVFFLARAVFKSQLAGAVAALLFAIHPAVIAYSLPMNFDHHALEPLVALLLFALPLLERRGRLPLAAIFMALCCLLLAIILWRGSTIYWGFAFVSVLLRVVIGNNRPLALSYSALFGAAALLLAVYCLNDPWGGARQFTFGVISWFHVCVLSGWASILLLFGLCRSRVIFFWCLGGGAAVGLAAVLAGPLAPFVKQLVGGLSFVQGQGDPWLEANSELRGVFKERYSFWYSASYLTLFWFVAPLAVWWSFRQWNKGGRADLLPLNFLVWSPLLAMGFIIRYSHIAGLFVSLAAGSMTAALWSQQGAKQSRWLMAVGLFLALLPGAGHLREAMRADLPGYMKEGLHGKQGLLAWLREKTPVTSHWLNPTQRPEYGVLARWPLGARIYQVAQRPSLSTAFGWETYGFYQEAAFWVTEDEAKAVAITRESRIRYVVVQAIHDLKSDFDLVLQGQERGDLPPHTANTVLRPERAMHTRLLPGDGSMMQVAGSKLPALESFRLVYESPYLVSHGDGTPGDQSYYQVYEVVKGALVTGKVARVEPVILTMELQTSRQRPVTYLSVAHVAQDGSFSVRVPYATTAPQGDSKPLGAYTVYVGRELKGKVEVSEADVVNGGTVIFN